METPAEYTADDNPARVRDARTEKRFFVDNVIIRGYGPLLGVYGISVYAALCMHANLQTQQGFPAHRTIAEQIGCSIGKVKGAIRQLEKLNLIQVEARFDPETERRTSNLYTILDPPVPPVTTDTLPSYAGVTTNNPNLDQSYLEREGANAQRAPDDDALFYGTESPPEHPTLKTRLPQTSDPLVMAAHCQKARQAETLQTVPEVTGQKNGLSPACQEFKRATGYMPPKPWRDEITKRVGGDADALKRWYDTCFAYVGNGWNPRNAKGMLDYFVVGAVPDTKPQGGNGRHDGAAGGNRVEGNGFRAMPKGPGR